MDVEKTIQFLIENAAQHDARLAALENNNLTLGNALITLTAIVKALADNLAEHERITQAERARLDAESRKRDAELDERINKLVSAIAALPRARPNS